MPRIKEESLTNIIDELVDRCDSACIVLNLKASKDPCIVYHGENYSIKDILSIVALLDIGKDWFKGKLANFELDDDEAEEGPSDTGEDPFGAV